MKKLFLLLTAGVISLGAGAQENKSFSMVHIDGTNPMPLPLKHSVKLEDLKKLQVHANSDVQHKPTAGGSRTYNYVYTIAALNSGILDNNTIPYMWFRPDIMAAYGDPNNPSGPPVADTINFASYAAVLHPQIHRFNDALYFDEYYPDGDGTIIGIQNEAYTLDSVSVYGYYGRNINKPNVVDTLRFAFLYGDGNDGTNLPTGGLQSGNIQFAAVLHDTANNVGAGVQGGPAVIYQDLYLTIADTLSTGLHRFTVPANLSVPAGQNMVAVTVTFKSGEDGQYTPYQDTAFLSDSWDPTNPFKYGLFRALFFEENAGQQPTYTAGNFNAGYIKPLPVTLTQSWEQQYIPHWAYTAPSVMEYPFVDFHITCPTCSTVAEIPQPPAESVYGISGVITRVSAYPNPAQDFLRIPVTLAKATDVKVSLINTVGQVLQTQQLHGNAVTAEFNTAGIPAGVYIYSVEANGQRSTGRVSISK